MKKDLAFLAGKKQEKKKITMLSCYDYPHAFLAEKAGVDIILLGDSVGTKMLGYTNPAKVTMGDMIHHLKAVHRAVVDAYLMGDLPLASVQTPTQALTDSKIFVDHGANGVKIEVFDTEIVSPLSKNGIEVCVDLIYPFLLQRSPTKTAADITAEFLKIAVKHEEAGAALLVFTMAPEEIAKLATERLKIPAIGVGAGRYTDGQVLIAPEMLGMTKPSVDPYYNKQYDKFEERTFRAFEQFVHEVAAGRFPVEENVKHASEAEMAVLEGRAGQ